jgi:hypothetical protein
MFVLIAFELVSHPEQRTENGGAIIAGQIDDPGFDDKATAFDQMPRALAALDLPRAHVMPRSCHLMAVAGRPVAPERRQRHGQVPEQIAATGLERTRPRAWTMPPSVNRRRRMPPRTLGKSKACRANRLRDPTPIYTGTFTRGFEMGDDPDPNPFADGAAVIVGYSRRGTGRGSQALFSCCALLERSLLPERASLAARIPPNRGVTARFAAMQP